jgi:hypothetical protein
MSNALIFNMLRIFTLVILGSAKERIHGRVLGWLLVGRGTACQ